MKSITEGRSSGWLVDLSPKECQGLIGATVTLFWNLKAATGLLIKVEDGIAHLFRPDEGTAISFEVAGTRFERTPGTPLRPALARAVVLDREWSETDAALRGDHDVITDQETWDSERDDYVERLPDIHGELLWELLRLTFPTPRKETV
ncbi:hypothetical protein [Actinacidiphila sp. ITFR-21]|uniref:hypothetical protein n=1 Tax=Actinacidiphila sp. ITFR-21 TaxID=3075199 RepID=UPI00288AF4E3|nr:hypothetical protein [Streptomyces sp. ITFR-21]WNI17686.1 hypothetical protein RLT57_20565 [Streptomyces sp. ITFR-21]WNI17826.1 hypothetical protein RLT57_21280 [Streptomyces sp. ITFR-21]